MEGQNTQDVGEGSNTDGRRSRPTTDVWGYEVPSDQMLPDQYYSFVNGFRNHGIGSGTGQDRDYEYVPDLMPAPLFAEGRSGRRGRHFTPQADAQPDSDLFSDAPRTKLQHLRNIEPTNTKYKFNFGGEDQIAEDNRCSNTDKTPNPFVFKGAGISADNPVSTSNLRAPLSLRRSRQAPTKQQKSKMAGRGRGGRFNPGQLKGATWEYDSTAVLESKPSELFPPHPNLKKPAPLTDKELREINNYRTLQAKVHRGPLFTQSTKRDADAPTKTFSEEQFNAQYGGNAKADMDPFTGVETYSMRYAPKKNTLPKLSDAPFDKSLFPEELWDTLDGKAGADVKKNISRAMQRKALMLAGGGDNKEKTKLMLEKINDAVDGVDDEDDEEEDDAAVDSEFEDDDGGDYDAEQYFDGGEDGDDDDGDDPGQEY